MTRIVTKRLVLRRAEPGDLEAMFAVLSHRAATRYWSTPPHESLEQTRPWLTSMIDESDDDFVVTLEGRVIGKAGFFRDPEVGFILHPDVHGRGYGHEAVRAVVERALLERGLPEIDADVDPRNEPCLTLLSRLGFVETGRQAGTWQVGDELCDSVYLSLNAEQFRRASRS